MAKDSTTYDPQTVSRFYDDYGNREWEWLDRSAHDRLIYHLHRHFLHDHIGVGKKVLDAGCGAGRFSIAMAESGSSVSLADISQNQLRIAQENLSDGGYHAKVADVRYLKEIGDDSFDAEAAVNELMRVARRGGSVVVSVANVWGPCATL